MAVPEIRIEKLNDATPDASGRYVFYWMTANARPCWNFALERALDLADEMGKPLVVAETLCTAGPWGSERHHLFALQGMAENAAAFSKASVLYYPYVERRQGQAGKLAAAIASKAAAVITDEHPTLWPLSLLRNFAAGLRVAAEAVDSNGLLPIRTAEKVYLRAYDFRRFLHAELAPHLACFPARNPLQRSGIRQKVSLPAVVRRNWPPQKLAGADSFEKLIARLPIDHDVRPVTTPGGAAVARKRLRAFSAHKLAEYAAHHNEPERDATSGLSPYLSCGHISAHEVFSAVAEAEGWSPERLVQKPSGKRHGWWGMRETAEAFLDELVTWREAGFNMCGLWDDYDRYESLPQWARETLEKHASDKREYVYSIEEFEGAATHDHLWNAAQRQLLAEGVIHNYLRMLWGKKILEWTASPRKALAIMIELNNKYALDGRNPNSYTGIFWVLGRYDRPWGPERPIFGKVRYMSSENAARKFALKRYVAQYAPMPPADQRAARPGRGN